MFDFVHDERVLQVLLLALPAAVLLVLIVLLGSRRRGRKHKASHTEVSGRPLTMLDDVPSPPTQTKSKPVLSVASLRDRLQALNTQVKQVEASDDRAALANLYLQTADTHAELGEQTKRMTALRSAAGLAARFGPRTDHAAARLALAEAAYAAGDLTSACEHWQLARAALLDDGQDEASARIDKRMRDNGCPTDWVLTDF